MSHRNAHKADPVIPRSFVAKTAKRGGGFDYVTSHANYNPHRDPRVAGQFQGVTFRAYDPEKDENTEWLCGTPACGAKMNFRKAVAYEGVADDINRAHFATNPKQEHVENCVYDKPKLESKVLSLGDAVEKGAPIVVNINNLPCGFTGATARDYALWIQDKKPGTYYRHAAHSVADVLGFIEKVKLMGGSTAPKQMEFNSNGRVIAHEKFAMVDQKEGGLVANTAYLNLLREFYYRATTFQDLNEIQGATRLIEFTGSDHDPRNPDVITGAPFVLRRTIGGAPVLIDQTLHVVNYADYLQTLGNSMEAMQADRALTALKRPHATYYVMATPVLVLPSNAVARAALLKDIKAAMDGKIPLNAKLYRIKIEYRLDKDFMKQIQAKAPALKIVPPSDFQSGISHVPVGTNLATTHETAPTSASKIVSPSIAPEKIGTMTLFGEAVAAGAKPKPAPRSKSAALRSRSESKVSGQPRFL